MKFIPSLVLLLALGLSNAQSLDFGEDAVEPASPETQDFMTHLIDGDEDEFEIVDMDDALTKYRMLKDIARIVAQGEALDMLHKKKRFIGGIWDTIKNAVKKAANKVADFFKAAWNKAKSAFQSVTHKVNFKATVNKLIPFIHSGMTVNGCKAALAAAAATVLGPVASLVGAVATPLCDAALAKLEDVAG